MKRSYMMAGDISGATKRRVAAGDNSMTLVVALKRRGRPPKSDLAISTSQRGRLLKPDATCGRRGRPPKMVLAVDENGLLGERRRGGRPKKVFQPGVVSGHVDGSVERRNPGRPAKVKNFVSGDVEGSRRKRRPGGLAKVAHPVSGHVDGFVGKRKLGRSAKIAYPFSEDIEGSVGKRKPGRPSKVVHPVSGVVEGSVGKRKPGRPSKVVHPLSGVVEESVGKRKPGRPSKVVVDGSVGKRKPGRPTKIVHPVSRDVEGSVGRKKPRRHAKIVHTLSGDVERSVGKRKPKPGRPAKVVNPTLGDVKVAKVAHSESGDVERSTLKRKPGRPAKVVEPEPGLTLVTSNGETPIEKRKSGPSQKLLQLMFGSKNGAAGAFTRKRKRGCASVGVSFFEAMNRDAEVSSGKKKLGRLQPGSVIGAVKSSSRKKPGRPKKFVDESVDKKLSRPRKIMKQSLNSAIGSVEASAGKRKQGRPRKIVLPNLNSIDGAVKISDGSRKPRQLKKAVLPDLNLTSEDVLHLKDTDQHAGAMGSVDGQMKMVLTQVSEFPDGDIMELPNLNSIDGAVKISDGSRKPRQLKKAILPDLNLISEDVLHLKDTYQHAGAMGSVDGQMEMVLTQVSEFPDGDIMFGSVAGLPKESANGEGDTYINNGNLVQLQKDVQTDLNGEVTKGRVVVNGGTTLMNSSQSSIGKRKLGRPKKLSQVDEDTTLLTQMQTSPGKLVGVAELAPDPVPAAVDVLLGMRNPGTAGKVSAISSAVDAFLNPVQESADNTAEGLKLGADGQVALTMPTKLSSPAIPGNGNVMMLNPVLSSPGEVVREVEIVMPTFKRRGRPAKKSR